MFKSLSANDPGKTLSLLWLFSILNMIFRDIHEMTMSDTITEILSGQMNGNPISENTLLASAFAVELLLLGFLLSSLLVSYRARLLNLGLAPLAIAGVLFVAPADPDDYFFATVEVCTFIAIFILAWRWRPKHLPTPVRGGNHFA